MNILFIALCPELTAPANGNVTVTGQSVGDTATYSCDAGFVLDGNASRTCTMLDPDASDWSLMAPVCISKFNITCTY